MSFAEDAWRNANKLLTVYLPEQLFDYMARDMSVTTRVYEDMTQRHIDHWRHGAIYYSNTYKK
jgi:hypothetical protein